MERKKKIRKREREREEPPKAHLLPKRFVDDHFEHNFVNFFAC